MDEILSPRQSVPLQRSFCPSCQYQILPTFFFCPNCGKVLRKKPLSTSMGKQISVYALSIFLPPIGLWPAFKYLFQNDTKSKVVGTVAVILTVISLVLSTYYTLAFVNQINSFFSTQALSGLGGY